LGWGSARVRKAFQDCPFWSTMQRMDIRQAVSVLNLGAQVAKFATSGSLNKSASERLAEIATLRHEAKSARNTLALQAHPDKGGSPEAMQAINVAYAELTVWLDAHTAHETEKQVYQTRLRTSTRTFYGVSVTISTNNGGSPTARTV